MTHAGRPRVGFVAASLDILGGQGVQARSLVDGLRDDGYVVTFVPINPRFPRQLWNRTALGINEPWMCLCIARGELVPAVERYPRGVLFVNPVEDAGLLAYQLADRLVYLARRGLRRYDCR